MKFNQPPTNLITVDAAQKLGNLSPIWRSFGYDELNWTYTPRGRQIYQQIGKLAPSPYYIRCHHTFTSGNGLSTPCRGSGDVYQIDRHGTVRLNFSWLDLVVETMLHNNCKPIIELGFMPDALSAGPQPKVSYFYAQNELFKYPPADYRKWEALIFETVTHFVKKYGAAEVEQWYWEVWNEPDCKTFFQGTVKDYCKMYDFAVAGATRALPTIRFGGPAVGNSGVFLDKFLKHCTRQKNAATSKKGSRLDFISFHAKGTGWPQPNKPVPMPSVQTIISSLRNYFRLLQKHEQFKTTPILLDECDMAVATNYGVYDFPEYVFHNTEYYPIFLIRLVKHLLDLIAETKLDIKFFTTWAFYFEGKRFFEGNRVLFTNENIKQPVFNAFLMLEKLGNERLSFDIKPGSSQPTIDGFATADNQKSVEIVIWNFDEHYQSQPADVLLTVTNLPFTANALSLELYQIDSQHSNAHTRWRLLGSPQNPTAEQIAEIKKWEGLEQIEQKNGIPLSDHKIIHSLKLPAQSVCLLKIKPDSSATIGRK